MAGDRKRIRTQAASIRAKNARTFWVSELRRRLGIDGEMGESIASTIHNHLQERDVLRHLGTITLPVIAGRKYNAKRNSSSLPRRDVAVQLIADEDVEVLEEFGNSAMLTARMARIIEDAYWDDGIFNGPLLALLFPLSLRTLRSRLRKLWAQGATLPLCGTSQQYRRQWRNLRPVLAMRRYLRGEEPEEIRRSLLISHARWSRWWDRFHRLYEEVRSKHSPERLAAQPEYPAPLVEEWLGLIDEIRRGNGFSQQRLMQLQESTYVQQTGYAAPLTVRYLTHRYDLDRTTAQQITRLAREFAADVQAKERGQIVHFAVCSQVSSSHSLKESRLCAVFLNYLTNEDWGRVDLQRPTGLRCQRLKRLIGEAYLQNSALSLPDVAHLLGMSTDAVSNVLRDEEETSLLIRGRVTILEPTLDRAERVIRLYCEEGLDLDQISSTTGYDRRHIEKYLRRFCHVVSLKRAGHDVTEVARRAGISPRAAQYCARLCDRLSRELADEHAEEKAFQRLQANFSATSSTGENGGRKP